MPSAKADRDRRGGQRLVSLVELPLVDALAAVPKTDAAMLQQVPWRCRGGMRLEIGGRSDDGRPEVRRHKKGHHVLGDELAELNACLVARRHQIDTAVVG